MNEHVQRTMRDSIPLDGARSSAPVGTVLVVDDELELRRSLVEALTARGYEANGCASGNQALAELQQKNFDILLTDLMMPEMDGIALLKAALEIDPHLVSIIMTGQGTIQTAVDAMKLGAFDYVLKPFRMLTLMPVLTRAMNTRRLRLENLQLRETLAIYGLSQTIAFTLDSQTVLSKLADAALQQSDADEVSILLPTDDGSELYVAAVRGAKRERLLGERIPFAESIASWVARERTPVILNGAVNDERFVALWPRPDIRSSISVPMQVANKLVGVINLNVTRRLRAFTLGQMKALTILAGTAAAALESASLYKRVQHAEQNYRSIFENAADGIFRATPDGTRFLSVNPAMARMFGYESPAEMVKAVVDITQQLGVKPERRDAALRRLSEQGELKNFEDRVQRKDGSEFWISANVRAVVGAEDELFCLDGIVQDITERKRAEAERLLMFEIIQGVITTTNLDELLKLIHHSISKLLYAENCFVALHDETTNLIHFEYWVDKFDPVPPPHPLRKGFASYVLRTNQPLLLTEELKSRVYGSGEVEKSGRSSASWLGVPLRTPARPIGVLVIQHYEDKNAYTQRDLEFLSSVGDQIALAIERKRAEEGLRESEERYRLLFESNPQPMWVYDLETLAFLAVNESAVHHYGYSREDFLAMTIKDIRPAEDIPALLDSVAKVSRVLDSAGSWRHRKKDGMIIEVEITSHPLVFDGRRAELILAIDITERKRAENALRESEERYRELVENAHDIIYEHDLEGNYTSTNRAGEQITGYSREEILKLNLAQTVAPEYLEKSLEIFRRELAGETITAYEMEIVARDGRRISLEVNSSRVLHNGVPVGVQGIARDVTERKQLEEQLRQSQKLEAIGQLAGGVAHDFNNLLTVISGYSDLLLRRLPADGPLKAHVTEIKKAGERASGLTRQLLAFSRKQILQPKVLDLNAVVSDLDKMLRRLIGEDVDVMTITEPGLGQVKADPGQIEQVVVNLVVNARDAMTNGGKVTIETANANLTEDYAQQHAQCVPGAYVMLAVSDNGSGIDPAIRDRIFEPFFSTKGAGKGTGLGLSTVWGIVKQSGGHIWVYSEVDKGTTFKIYLPRVDEGVNEESDRAQKTAAPGGNETILLVEDEAQVRQIAQQILEALGYRVIAAENGEQALTIAAAYPNDINLMVTDVVMPQMGGRELVERLSPLRPSLRVIFMSGYTDDAIVRHGLMDDRLEFIQKPFTADALARKVRATLDSER